MANDAWTDIKLSDVIDVKHGFAFSGDHIADEPPGDILLTPGNFAVGGGFKRGKYKYYRGPVPEEYVLHEGDLIVTMTDLSKQSDTLGYAAIVPTPVNVRFLHNQRLGRVLIRDSAKLDGRFTSYLLRTDKYRREVLAGATGTTVKHTSPDRILNYRTSIPPLSEQRAIAQILGSLDDKIELNRRMNDTLEAMARALFQSWFVDFDPVRAKGEGRAWHLSAQLADLFPGSFESSELGEIPNGWNSGTLGDVADHPRRSVRPDEIDPATPYIALEHMPRRSIALSEWGLADGLESNKFEFERGEMLFGKLRPYFHKVGIAPVNGVCSTDIVVVAPRKDAWFGFVLGHLCSDAFVNYTNSGSTGTKMPRTSWSEMARYQTVLPPKNIAAAFTDLIRPLTDRIIVSIHECRTLAALRDTLLPKLISGELRVKDAEQFAAGGL